LFGRGRGTEISGKIRRVYNGKILLTAGADGSLQSFLRRREAEAEKG
jgi:hypothetical protein